MPKNHKFIAKSVSIISLLTSSSLMSTEYEVRHQGILHDALYDVCFAGGKGVAVGAHGQLLTSMDEGVTWEAEESQFSKAALLGIDCQGPSTVVVGQEGLIFLNQDEKWLPVDSSTDQRLFSVSIDDSGFGLAVGGFGTVIRTLDYGNSWQTLSIDWETILNDFVEPHIYDIHIDNAGVVSIIGEFELIMQSYDQGNSWQVVHKGDASLFGLHINNSGLGLAVGQDGTVLKSFDGGASWQKIATNTTGILLDVWSSEQGKVVVSGIRNLLMSDDFGATWQALNNIDIQTGWYQSVSAVNNSKVGAQSQSSNPKVYVAGHSGRVVKVN